MIAYFNIIIPHKPQIYGIITVKTSHLIPVQKPVINPKRATYWSSKFTIIKIEVFNNQTLIQTVSEIQCLVELYGPIQRFQINQTISIYDPWSDSTPEYYFYKSKNIIQKSISPVSTGCLSSYHKYHDDGSLSYASFYRNGVNEKIISAYSIHNDKFKIIRNYKKNKTIYIKNTTDRFVFEGIVDFCHDTNLNISSIQHYRRFELNGINKVYRNRRLVYKDCFKNNQHNGLSTENTTSIKSYLYISGYCMGPYKMKLPWDFITHHRNSRRIVIY
jgi:antitoxin component YwqK of YwqJK toxin-antitoxin module